MAMYCAVVLFCAAAALLLLLLLLFHSNRGGHTALGKHGFQGILIAN